MKKDRRHAIDIFKAMENMMTEDGKNTNGADVSDLERYLPYHFHLVTAGLSSRFLERLRPYGVTVQRWRVLMVIMTKGPRNIGELVKLTLIPQSALSRLIDQMERDGLVKRHTLPSDTRGVEVRLTDHGREIYRQLTPAATKHAQSMISGFRDEEVKDLFDKLQRILENLDVTPVSD